MLCADSRLRSVNRTADLALCLELWLWAKSSGLFRSNRRNTGSLAGAIFRAGAHCAEEFQRNPSISFYSISF
jgi:hypothetical protein